MEKNSQEEFSHSGSGHFSVVVETPRGSRNKYKWDEKTARFKLSKVMPEGMVFPYDFGYFPETRSEDGDPLDVLILSDEATFPGCQVDCRLVGVILARQRDKGKEEKTNNRIVAVAEASVLYSSVYQLSAMEPMVLKQIEDFFVNYQKVRDVEVTLMGREDSTAAKELLERAAARHREGRVRAPGV
jgi:inorganic pyrophosphatase